MKLADLLPWKSNQQSDSNQAAQLNLNEDMANNKVAALVVVETMKPLLQSSSEQLASLNRWILAALLTLNSGGIVTLITAAELLQRNDLLSAAKAFTIGITAALLSAILAVILSPKTFDFLGESLGYYVGVSQDGERVVSREKELKALGTAVNRRTLFPQLLALVSMGAFLTGIYFAISGVTQHSALISGRSANPPHSSK